VNLNLDEMRKPELLELAESLDDLEFSKRMTVDDLRVIIAVHLEDHQEEAAIEAAPDELEVEELEEFGYDVPWRGASPRG
jgi:hypothetical protein